MQAPGTRLRAGNFGAAVQFSAARTSEHGSSDSRYADGVRLSPRHLAAFIASNSLLLPIGVVTALVWANVSPHSYVPFADNAHFIVNDVGMTLFFALAAKEIVEATAPRGALHPLSKAATPVMAAIGGMVAPAAVYLGLVRAIELPELHRGWAIPTATDIAFSFLVARWLFGRNHPAVPFLLLLAIADDAFGLVVLALFYPAGVVRPLAFAGILPVALALCWLFRRSRSFPWCLSYRTPRAMKACSRSPRCRDAIRFRASSMRRECRQKRSSFCSVWSTAASPYDKPAPPHGLWLPPSLSENRWALPPRRSQTPHCAPDDHRHLRVATSWSLGALPVLDLPSRSSSQLLHSPRAAYWIRRRWARS